jgi:hypothetical protein
MRNVILASLVVAGIAAVPATAASAGSKHKCDPNYRGACLKANASDYDCAGGSGNGPYYVRGPVGVVGRDHYRLDADHDGIGCE